MDSPAAFFPSCPATDVVLLPTALEGCYAHAVVVGPGRAAPMVSRPYAFRV